MTAQGLPRDAGRVLGALLVADPPERTADERAERLQASRGLRLLERERPGARRALEDMHDFYAYWSEETRRLAEACLERVREGRS